jgi:purine nucleosidase
MRIVIDTDPGVDDAHAILLALAHPGTEVVALTTVAGNVSVERTTANALILLDVLHEDIPVFRGCEDALVIPTPRRATSHGKDGLGDSGYPASSRQPGREHAVNALIRMANESPGELDLIALGPLTNIAMATRLDPELPKRYKTLTVMGGAVNGRGNSWLPAAEFNFYVDPEAAAVVFQAWPKITLVPWEAAERYAFTAQELAAFFEIDTPRGEFFRRVIWNRQRNQISSLDVCYDADVLTMAIVLEPTMIQQMEKRTVKIELAGGMTRGQSVVDWYDITGDPPKTEIVSEVDRQRFIDLIRQCLSRS